MTQPAPTPLLARRVGPFTLLVWLIIVALLAGIFLWWRKRKAAAGDGNGSSLLGSTGVIGGTGPYMYAYPPGSVIQTSQPATNPQTPVPGTEPDPPATNTPNPPPATTTLTYTVKAGDTLSKIGAAFGKPWQSIYSANASTIEATARAHGFPSSQNGHWIFPQTVLAIPA